MNIAETIKKYRKEKGFTQKELAEKCGMAESTLRQYELGIRNPKIKTIKKIASALDLPSIDYYVEADNVPFIIEFQKSPEEEFMKRIYAYVSSLNALGKKEAEKRLEELVKDPKFQINFEE